MNPDTGELCALRRDEKAPEGFERLPQDLSRIARLKLFAAAMGAMAGASYGPAPARVNLRSGSPLAQWAKKKRKAKIAAASRRRNRK